MRTISECHKCMAKLEGGWVRFFCFLAGGVVVVVVFPFSQSRPKRASLHGQEIRKAPYALPGSVGAHYWSRCLIPPSQMCPPTPLSQREAKGRSQKELHSSCMMHEPDGYASQHTTLQCMSSIEIVPCVSSHVHAHATRTYTHSTSVGVNVLGNVSPYAR